MAARKDILPGASFLGGDVPEARQLNLFLDREVAGFGVGRGTETFGPSLFNCPGDGELIMSRVNQERGKKFVFDRRDVEGIVGSLEESG